jgi:hypothetical protein
MAQGDPKEPGRAPSRDVEDLKARLGLKVPRRAPAVTPVPPAAPAPPRAPAPPAAPGAAPTDRSPPAAPGAAPADRSPPAPPGAAPADRSPPATPGAAPATLAAPARAPALPRAYDPSTYAAAEPYPVEEMPARKSLWERWGKRAVYGLIPAIMGMIVGYVFAKGATRGAMLSKVKADASKILGIVNNAYGQVEEIASIIDPAYGKARRERAAELPTVRWYQRREVGWPSIEALGKIESLKDVEQIFDTDYKRFNRLTVKLLVAFFIDYSRLQQAVQDHVERTKAARMLLDAEAKAGATPRLYGVMGQSLPGLERGEVVVLRGRRLVKKGGQEVPVYDVVRRTDPGTPIAVPGNAVVILNAPGLFKESGVLLEEYNRRLKDITEIVRRMLDVRRNLTLSIEKVAEIKV